MRERWYINLNLLEERFQCDLRSQSRNLGCITPSRTGLAEKAPCSETRCTRTNHHNRRCRFTPVARFHLLVQSITRNSVEPILVNCRRLLCHLIHLERDLDALNTNECSAVSDLYPQADSPMDRQVRRILSKAEGNDEIDMIVAHCSPCADAEEH